MFSLSRDRGQPVYLQLQEQVERRVASGVLRPGDALPSVRALATELRVNPNTIVRAYRELELRGLVESRHGEGTFIAAGAPRTVAAGYLLDERAGRFVREARELGASRKDALDAVAAAWNREEERGTEDAASLRSRDVPLREASRARGDVPRAQRR